MEVVVEVEAALELEVEAAALDQALPMFLLQQMVLSPIL